MKLLLDTTVLVDVLRSRHGRREFLASAVRAGHTLSTTSLNIAEIYVGMRPAEEARTELFLQSLQTFDITIEIGRSAGRLKSAWARKGRTLSLDDTIIAAAAIENNCALVTDNRKDFPMPELQLFPFPPPGR
jgi:predicted nucleic acid-binding protein